MPNNSCTVILNGHGFYNSTKIINLSASIINYNIIFPCGLKESISAAHHNLIMGTLAVTNPIIQSLSLIEGLISTTIIKGSAPSSFVTDVNHIDGASRVSNIINEHILTDAIDVVRAHSLVDFNQLFQRFLSYDVKHISNPSNPRVLLSNESTLQVQFDAMQVSQDVIKVHGGCGSNVGITLSANNLLYIKPVSLITNVKVKILLSDLISDILPKLKIVAIYHSTKDSVDIIPAVFLDDNSDNTLQQKIMATFTPTSSSTSVSKAFSNSITSYSGDVYHELTIGDANIV